MQAYLLVLDDIEDRSLIRRGQPCWHQYNDIGLAAINDGLMLKTAVFYLIRKHFKGKHYYVNLLETFHDVSKGIIYIINITVPLFFFLKNRAILFTNLQIIFKTLLGQSLDLISTNFDKNPILDSFTMDRYDAIAEYKTSYYTYILPVIVAMHLVSALQFSYTQKD